jgi:RHS repeat-associated protein
MRLHTQTDTGGASPGTVTNHYADSSDSPAWITETDGTWTRNIIGLDGTLAAIQTSTGTVTLQLADLHGDINATADDNTTDTSTSAYFEQTEYGQPRTDNATNPDRYGWLGGKKRSVDSLAGLVLMGARLYNPATGRFLSVDPDPGGSCNPYDYACQDPINGLDLDGRWPHWHSVWHAVTSHWRGALEVTAFGACVVASFTVCAGAGLAVVGFKFWGDAKTHGWGYAGRRGLRNLRDYVIGLTAGGIAEGAGGYVSKFRMIKRLRFTHMGRHSARFFRGAGHLMRTRAHWRAAGYGVNIALGHAGCGDGWRPRYC